LAENSAVEDVAFSVQSQFALEPAHAAYARCDPDGAEFLLVRRRRRLHGQLLEAVLQAAITTMRAGNTLGSRVIDRNGHLLALLTSGLAAPESPSGLVRGVSAIRSLKYLSKAAKRTHDA
jgi:hypothetical protein